MNIVAAAADRESEVATAVSGESPADGPDWVVITDSDLTFPACWSCSAVVWCLVPPINNRARANQVKVVEFVTTFVYRC